MDLSLLDRREAFDRRKASMRGLRQCANALIGVCAFAVLLFPVAAAAQQVDSARVGVSIEDGGPPISPGRAFLYSFVLPGAGQAKLDRAYAGGMFFLIEIAAITLANRSAEDLRIARSFAGDSVPMRFRTDPNTGVVMLDGSGQPIVDEWRQTRYNDDWIRARKLHYEDWIAVLFFNHLFAGADAYVAAHLWDLPTRVGMRQTPFGPLISATISFR